VRLCTSGGTLLCASVYFVNDHERHAHASSLTRSQARSHARILAHWHDRRVVEALPKRATHACRSRPQREQHRSRRLQHTIRSDQDDEQQQHHQRGAAAHGAPCRHRCPILTAIARPRVHLCSAQGLGCTLHTSTSLALALMSLSRTKMKPDA